MTFDIIFIPRMVGLLRMLMNTVVPVKCGTEEVVVVFVQNMDKLKGGCQAEQVLTI